DSHKVCQALSSIPSHKSTSSIPTLSSLHGDPAIFPSQRNREVIVDLRDNAPTPIDLLVLNNSINSSLISTALASICVAKVYLHNKYYNGNLNS
ncbi:hypothetical protein RUND412_011462, partial [Rhizina undulata]